MSRVPRIRFKGFEEDWEQRKVGAICSISTGKSNTQDRVEDGKYPFYVRSSIVERSNRYLFDEEAVLTVGDGVGTGKVFHYVDGKYDLHQRVYRMFGFEKDISAKYFFYYFSNNFYDRVMAMTAKTSVDSVRHEMIADMDIIVPCIKEQKFISGLFQNFDHLITLHQRKLEKLKIIKKSMLENLFPQNGEKTSKIRFSGFTKDWEQRKLGEVCNIITKQTGFDYSSTIKPALLKEKADNTYPFIQNKDFNGTTINMDTDFFIPISIAEKFPNILLDRPSLLISISGRIGNVGFYSCVHKAFIGGAVGICKLKYDDDGKFIIHELESEYGQKYFRLLIKASSHANITVEDIRNIELIFPNQKEEKVCISTFFSTLDHLITLHQRKLEKLKIIKKSMLENLFPQNGEKTSKIRFSGFTKDWEQRKLGEVCNIITKQTGFDYSSTIKPALLKEKADNTYPFIQNKDFNGTTINMDTDFFIPISIAEKFPNILLDRPSLLISISGRIGNVGFYSCVHKAFIGGAVGICKLKYDDDGKFIIHELESEYGQKYFRLLIKASSHANITVEDIRNIELIFPNQKEEKVCISTFFSTLDHLITLHQRKLDKLQKIKKSMLECMFI